MNLAHTPAPWSVEIDHRSNDPELIRAHVDGEMYDLASVLCDETGNAAANARLMAAAPNLLAALREIVAAVETGDVDGYSPSGDWFREAKAAIAKATGELA